MARSCQDSLMTIVDAGKPDAEKVIHALLRGLASRDHSKPSFFLHLSSYITLSDAKASSQLATNTNPLPPVPTTSVALRLLLAGLLLHLQQRRHLNAGHLQGRRKDPEAPWSDTERESKAMLAQETENMIDGSTIALWVFGGNLWSRADRAGRLPGWVSKGQYFWEVFENDLLQYKEKDPHRDSIPRKWSRKLRQQGGGCNVGSCNLIIGFSDGFFD